MSGILNLLLGSAAGVIKDAYFNLVTLLLNTTATNGAQNNTFLDSSTNNFTITRNGNATQGTFTPFSQTGWGTYFTGSSTRLTYPGSSSTYVSGTGDFTIEMWINIDAASAGRSRVLIEGDVSNGIQMRLGPSNTNNINGLSVSRVFNADNEYCNYTFAFNTWYHVAVTRASAVYYFFVNGVQYTTQNAGQTGTYNFQVPTTVCIGDNLSYPNDEIYKGYISNIRVSNVGRYTSNFTPSTTPLTALSGTQFLSLQNNRWIDNSTNNSTISSNGTPSVQAFSPFAPTDAYSTTLVGGSGYFDGSGDYLSGSGNTNLNFGTGDFTVELYVYVIAYPSSGISIFIGGGTASGGDVNINLYVGTNGYVGATFDGAGEDAATAAGAIKTGNWQHIALVRSGNNFTIYINGVSAATGTSSSASTLYSTSGWYVGGNGASSSQYLNGYVSSVRVLKGTALYTTTFTPPTAPLTAITNTSLLLSATNAGIYDSTAKNVNETIGNAQVSTTQAKFGTTSIYFDGNGDYLTIPVTQNLNIGSGDFTIECFVYTNNAASAQEIIMLNPNSNASSYATARIIIQSSTFKYFLSTTGSGPWSYSGGSFTPSSSTWYHLALVRNGATVTFYVNGTSNATSSVGTDTFYFGDANTRIGNVLYSGGNEYLDGYIDELRITKGYARYTANFTPPAAAFPIQ